MRRTVEETIAHFGKLDVLINSAGILAMGSIETADVAQYDKVMAVNVRYKYRAQISFVTVYLDRVKDVAIFLSDPFII